MSRALLILLLVVTYQASARTPDITELRALYYSAPADRAAANRFFSIMESLPVQADPLLTCYKGMAWLLKANFSINPYNKWTYFNKGKELLEAALKRDPGNVEIRFMRFCVQTNVPSFLNYNSQINTDRTMVLKAWPKIEDNDLKQRIKKYMHEKGKCSAAEKLTML
jgi:hypothetical protein